MALLLFFLRGVDSVSGCVCSGAMIGVVFLLVGLLSDGCGGGVTVAAAVSRGRPCCRSCGITYSAIYLVVQLMYVQLISQLNGLLLSFVYGV